MLDDNIDTEALQAQIDLSLSFTEDLVSSWIKPSTKVAQKLRSDIDAELKEYMRRPPRLGVGTSIPQGSSSREAVRLKNHLVGKAVKRPRAEEDLGEKKLSDDEEESRARAFKKKARIDPFERGGKAKKSNVEPPQSGMASQSSASGKDKDVQAVARSADENASSTPKRKKKKKDGYVPQAESPASGSTPIVKSKKLDPQRSPSSSNEPSTQREAATIPTKKLAVIDISPVPTPKSRPLPISLHASPSIVVLNLDGPPDSDNSEGDEATNSPTTSPKKKRRRKKKKKGLVPPTAPESKQ